MPTSPARQALLDALGTVPGLRPTPTMPDTPMPGSTWPVWAESRYGPGKLCRPLAHVYEIRVVLPAGWLPETVDTADGLVEQIAAALSRVAQLDLLSPVQITFDNSQTMPGINARVTLAA